jgi:hypothetical protein
MFDLSLFPLRVIICDLKYDLTNTCDREELKKLGHSK